MSRARDDCGAEAGAGSVVLPERFPDVVRGTKRIGQRHGIAARLGDAHTDVRARHERGIAHQRDPAEHQLRGLDVVDRLEERLLREPDHLCELGREQRVGVVPHASDHLPADQRRRDRHLVRAAAFVGEQIDQSRVFGRRPIPDEVVAPVPALRAVAAPATG